MGEAHNKIALPPIFNVAMIDMLSLPKNPMARPYCRAILR